MKNKKPRRIKDAIREMTIMRSIIEMVSILISTVIMMFVASCIAAISNYIFGLALFTFSIFVFGVFFGFRLLVLGLKLDEKYNNQDDGAE